MTTEPLAEAKATSRPVYDLPEVSVSNEADEDSANLPGKSLNPDSQPDSVPSVTPTLTEQQDVDRASVVTTIATEQDEDQISIDDTTFVEQDEEEASLQTATSMEEYVDQVFPQITALIRQYEEEVSRSIAKSMGQDVNQASMQMASSLRQDRETAISIDLSTSGDKDKSPDGPSHNQENTEETTSLLPQEPGILQVFVGFQNPVWDRLAENNRASRSRSRSSTVSPSDSQNQEKTPEKLGVPEGQPEIAPNADALPEGFQPSVGATDPSTLDPSSPDLEPMGITKSAEQEAEGVKALNPESKARPPVKTREDLAEDSTILQTPPSLSSPAGSAPSSPDLCPRTLGRNLLDPSQYRSDVENDYMRSMTSLLGGGEGSISSLADILVWSDTATGMGLAVGFLASGRSSPSDRLRDEGPSLRTVSSILGSTRSAFSSGLVAGTGSALRSVTRLLESVERRTAEGIRSAVRYLTSHFTLRWERTAPNSD
ncbi:hypothetical protein STEG23_000362 [Scotinomys teguina]